MFALRNNTFGLLIQKLIVLSEYLLQDGFFLSSFSLFIILAQEADASQLILFLFYPLPEPFLL